VNKFLNRLLGMKVEVQNGLFDYFMQVFRWVVMTAKAQGRADPSIETVSGESVNQKSPPEVIYRDDASSALTMHYALELDSGLSYASAQAFLANAVRKTATIRTTQIGGATGFWQQQRSSRVILALEASGSQDKEQRLYRVLRPTLHSSTKPQYIRFKQLETRYTVVRDEKLAEKLWTIEYNESEKIRLKDDHLLCGAIMPLWIPLHEVLRSNVRKQQQQLMLRRAEVNGRPIIGVSLSRENMAQLKVKLEQTQGGNAQLTATLSAQVASRVAREQRERQREQLAI